MMKASNGVRYVGYEAITPRAETMKCAEFFPGQSHLPGNTLCRGWLCPAGVGLILPYSLVSVEPGADRYSERSQLWRDSDGCYWIINYQAARLEWSASKPGLNHEHAKAALATARAAEALDRMSIAERILEAAGDKTREEIWDLIKKEEGVGGELVFGKQAEEFYELVAFRDGSKLRVLHPASIHYEQSQLVTVTRT